MKKVLFGEILGPEEEAKRSERVKRRFFETFRKAARYIPFAEELVAAYYCALDPATPHRVRAMLLGRIFWPASASATMLRYCLRRLRSFAPISPRSTWLRPGACWTVTRRPRAVRGFNQPLFD